MSAATKISDAELARMRRLSEDGWAPADLAEAFGVSRQHVGRLIRGEQRPVLPVLDEALAQGGVSEAVDLFLRDLYLRGRGPVLAATARALATKLDACSGSTAAAAAQAAPRLASELTAVMTELCDDVPAEPDRLDEIQAKRATRRAAVAAVNGGAR